VPALEVAVLSTTMEGMEPFKTPFLIKNFEGSYIIDVVGVLLLFDLAGWRGYVG
jgi:hypothetical protein